MIALVNPVRIGGRVAGRALFLGVCALGLATAAQGAWIPVKAALAQVLLNRAFEASLAEHRPVRPWAWADTAPVARVSVPRLGVSDVVLSGGSGQAMAFGPTRLRASTDGRVTVLAAHRDTHFAFVRDLRAGDEVVVEQIDGTTQRYRVTAFQTVRWDRFAVPRDPARRMLALATCWPFGATEHGPWRRVAWAEMVDESPLLPLGEGYRSLPRQRLAEVG
ncbi:MAG: class GN sortase [Sphingomonadales bacterium]|nr:class GN sortase [Sphingomonadales bacterium]